MQMNRKRKAPDRKDLHPGQKYGRWTVVKKSTTKKHNQTAYVCICSCGTVREVTKNQLTSGASKSCGCISKEKLVERNTNSVSPKRLQIEGERFGKLVALEPCGTKRGRVQWKCICDCGRISEVSSSNLFNGRTTSCGCVGSLNIVKCINAQKDHELVEGTNLCLLNSNPPSNNTSGRKGVFFDSRSQLWIARIGFKGKRYYLGSFKDFNKAVAAREEAEQLFYVPTCEKYNRVFK